MKAPPRPLRLRLKLFAGLGMVALMMLALQAFSSRVIAQATTQLELALNQQVRPLARINGLQAQLGRLRVLEVELPRVSDFFAVTAHSELMRSERMMFAHQLRRFIADQPDPSRLELRSLDDNWRRYDADLQRVSSAAAAMNMKMAEDITSFESSTRFKSLSHHLRQMVEATESEAAKAFSAAAAQQESQRRAFVALSMFTLVVVVFGGAMFTRSLSHRISSLHDAAAHLADGVLDEPAQVAGCERMWQTILAGREWTGELLNRRRDGTLHWELVRISPVTGADGSITHFVTVQEDIAARKNAGA